MDQNKLTGRDLAKARGRVRRRKVFLRSLALLAILGAVLWLVWPNLSAFLDELWELIQDREAFKAKIESYGIWAPLIFVAFQIFQAVISPFPGEIVVPAGGYIFGWLPCLIYTTIGLGLGSWLNFFLARWMGAESIRYLVPPRALRKLGRFMDRQGTAMNLVLFQVPGFPKDYYCFALGLTPINWKVFMLISSLGRIPGNLVLAIQGDLLFRGHYFTFAIITALSLVLMVIAWFYRERIYNLLTNNQAPDQ